MINLAFLINLVLPKGVSADVSVSESAYLSSIPNYHNSVDIRVQVLRNYLSKHNSPLTVHSETFIKYADKYGLDWRLVPAITGVESTFGKRIPVNSYNAYGWANGDYYFDSWDQSIEHVTKTIRLRYFDKGHDTIAEIAPIYAPPSNTWAWKVNYFMNEIDCFPLQADI